MEFHKLNKAKLTIVTRRIEKKSQYGVLEINKNKIVKTLSKNLLIMILSMLVFM